MFHRISFVFLFIFSTYSAGAQTMDVQRLQQNSYEDLIDLFDETVRDTLNAKAIAKAYILKAKADIDSTKMARGYQRMAFVSEIKEAVAYLDTTIALSKNSTHANFPATGYLFKSYYLYISEKYEESLQNAVTAYQYAKKKKNVDQQITALHQINGVNELWGDYEKALETELVTRELLFQNKKSELFAENYLASLEGIGNCFVRLRKPDSALVYYQKGIVEALKNKDTITYHAFVSKSGNALAVKGKYRAARDSLQKAHIYKEYFINSYETQYNYYMGTVYMAENNTALGIHYFKKVDSIYAAKKVLYPELPEVYDKLVGYYKANGDQQTQLLYMQKLVDVVKKIDAKRVNVKSKIAEEYEIPLLLEEKNELIIQLEKTNAASRKTVWGIGGVLIISLLVLLYYIRRQRLFKKRFQKLMEQQEEAEMKLEVPNTSEAETTSQVLDISEEIVADIMKQLEVFEREKQFLSSKVKLTALAKACNTNSTYLSKVINLKKGKNFSTYINELRVHYSFNELKTNSVFRKYTIKAIAAECGFKSAESFSKAFYKKNGIYPSYYIKQLEQNKT
ncbi:helix-turn-helix domain-containing protein [Rasiella sp. SM2506]|uniref:helix-turn-helix domain-containing protein n=1 Tax=Rasiella sp. SM2506 TaxID=3423914 RepID=UPI003D78C829